MVGTTRPSSAARYCPQALHGRQSRYMYDSIVRHGTSDNHTTLRTSTARPAVMMYTAQFCTHDATDSYDRRCTAHGLGMAYNHDIDTAQPSSTARLTIKISTARHTGTARPTVMKCTTQPSGIVWHCPQSWRGQQTRYGYGTSAKHGTPYNRYRHSSAHEHGTANSHVSTTQPSGTARDGP